MALRQFTILDPSGAPVGTQVCEGESCFPALQAGQSRVAATGAPDVRSLTTTLDPGGALVPPLPIPAAPPAPFLPEPPFTRGQPGGRAAIPATPAPSLPQGLDATAPAIAAQPPGASSPAPLLLPGSPPPYFGGGDAPPAPAYADGTTHPAMGGQPRLPGGPAAQQATPGFDNRQQVSVPGGAAAGPFETRAAYPVTPDYSGGSADRGGGGSSGGSSLARDLYWTLRNRAEARLSGMAGGGSSGAGYSSEAQYRRQGRRADRAYDRYNEALYDPPPQRATGWARQALGRNKGAYPAMLTDPIHVATEGMGLDPLAESSTFDFLNNAPAADLAFIIGGSGQRGMTRKTQAVKVPGILRQQGVKPTKPEQPRELDYSKYARQVRDIYSSMVDGADQNVLDSDFLLGNLAGARKNGALRLGIDQQAEYDPGGALDRAKGYFDSAFAGRSDLDRATYAQMAERYFAQEPLLNRKPKHISRTVNNVANRFLHQQGSG